MMSAIKSTHHYRGLAIVLALVDGGLCYYDVRFNADKLADTFSQLNFAACIQRHSHIFR